ncbi:X-linked lymphocyte-regulated protein 3A-like [Microtus oregoni]|uniref:X-linked lymphocyte-regulated protein 3A-like n=1 Tax=Microtus oregoni TaxID=111838 RepID=UPI001BB264C3|nr:X-linked lymphocyte-regulated protein 3A-like [Microtus oregoni]
MWPDALARVLQQGEGKRMSPQFSSAPYLYLNVELSDKLPLKIGPLLPSRPLEPNKNCLQGNSERFTAIITESFQTLELKFEDILKIQGEHRTVSDNIFKEQQKFIRQFLGIQKKRMEEFKDLCEQYLEKLVILRDSRGDSLIEELRRLIATLKIKLLMLNCQKENAAGQLSLLDLLFS